jgi:hypothetical protein
MLVNYVWSVKRQFLIMEAYGNRRSKKKVSMAQALYDDKKIHIKDICKTLIDKCRL